MKGYLRDIRLFESLNWQPTFLYFWRVNARLKASIIKTSSSIFEESVGWKAKSNITRSLFLIIVGMKAERVFSISDNCCKFLWGWGSCVEKTILRGELVLLSRTHAGRLRSQSRGKVRQTRLCETCGGPKTLLDWTRMEARWEPLSLCRPSACAAPSCHCLLEQVSKRRDR